MRRSNGSVVRTALEGAIIFVVLIVNSIGVIVATSTSAPAKAAPQFEVPAAQRINTTKQLLAVNAPVHIIHYSVRGYSPTLPIFTDIKAAFVEATDGQYVPRSVQVTEATYTTDLTCLTNQDATAVFDIQKSAKAHAVSEMLTVVAIDLPGCMDATNFRTTIGYGSPDGFAVVNVSGYSVFNHAVLHEVGHTAGLSHTSGDSVMSVDIASSSRYSQSELRQLASVLY